MFPFYQARRSETDDWVPILAQPSVCQEYSQSNPASLHEKSLLELGTFPSLALEFKIIDADTTPTNDRRGPVPQYAHDSDISNAQNAVLQRCQMQNLGARYLFGLAVTTSTLDLLVYSQFDRTSQSAQSVRDLLLFNVVYRPSRVRVNIERERSSSGMTDWLPFTLDRLFGTVVLPVAVCLTYALIINTAIQPPTDFQQAIPVILLVGVLGLPAFLVLITTRRWVYIGWMLVYLLSLPVWNFVLPVYSFIKMDGEWDRSSVYVCVL